eukprot:Hpha_TRINITY_DN26468_c0_g1::TRINITY_DN26468_c0_g1_i1::g.33981::m.33981
MAELAWIPCRIAAGPGREITVLCWGVRGDDDRAARPHDSDTPSPPPARGRRSRKKAARESANVPPDEEELAGLEGCEDLLGSVVWNSCAVLMRWLSEGKSFERYFRRKVVLELGAGGGAAGLAVSSMGAGHVVITDLDEYVPLIKHNIVANGLTKKASGAGLNWGEDEIPPPPADARFGRYDSVLMCDVLYGNREVWKGLAGLLVDIAATGTTDFVICHEHRCPTDLSDFVEMLGWEMNELTCGVSDASGSKVSITALIPKHT